MGVYAAQCHAGFRKARLTIMGSLAWWVVILAGGIGAGLWFGWRSVAEGTRSRDTGVRGSAETLVTVAVVGLAVLFAYMWSTSTMVDMDRGQFVWMVILAVVAGVVSTLVARSAAMRERERLDEERARRNRRPPGL